MFHRVGDVHGVAVDPRRLERVVEDMAGGTDERPPRDVLLIAGLLADEYDLGGSLPLPEDCLRRRLPKVAGLAMRRGIAPGGDAFGLRQVGIFMARLGLGLWCLGVRHTG